MAFKARTKYVSKENVYDQARARVRWLFDEFDGRVAVSNSGGKDSTVVLELAAEVARERGQKLNVTWLDQECEFQATVDYQRYIMYDRPDIDFDWYQIPFRLFNATNHADPWLNVWGEGEEWVREKEPDSIHENTFGTDRFAKVLSTANAARPGWAVLTGMRCEESPQRRLTMTTRPAYKWVTWSTHAPVHTGTTFRFHPIYDWTYRDVWKAIHDNGWRYNTHYDTQFRYGVKVRNMRVSNYHHVQSISSLDYLQEAEPETWEAATRRIAGISTQGHVGRELPASLPYMFSSWHEYLHHLIDNLVAEPNREAFRKHEQKALRVLDPDPAARLIARATLINDFYGVSIEAALMSAATRRRLEQQAKQEEDAAFTEEAA